MQERRYREFEYRDRQYSKMLGAARCVIFCFSPGMGVCERSSRTVWSAFFGGFTRNCEPNEAKGASRWCFAVEGGIARMQREGGSRRHVGLRRSWGKSVMSAWARHEEVDEPDVGSEILFRSFLFCDGDEASSLDHTRQAVLISMATHTFALLLATSLQISIFASGYVHTTG